MKQFFTCLKMAFLLTACAYQFQGLENPFQKLGIKKIYIKYFENNTFRPGLEHFFTKAMTEEIEKGGIFTLTRNFHDADAILTGSVNKIHAEPSTSLLQIDSKTTRPIATTFLASINCSIRLKDKNGKEIFYKGISSTKNYPAFLIKDKGNRLIISANNAAPLVNESEQRIAVRFLADRMMKEVYQAMINIF